MEGYKIMLLVESDERYLKVLDFEFKRWRRRGVFIGFVSHDMHRLSDGGWVLGMVGYADDEAFLAFIELVISERDKGNLSIYTLKLYETESGPDEAIVV